MAEEIEVTAADGGRFAEFVVLVDPVGIVRKTRRRAPGLS